jgi:hypothetical protein
MRVSEPLQLIASAAGEGVLVAIQLCALSWLVLITYPLSHIWAPRLVCFLAAASIVHVLRGILMSFPDSLTSLSKVSVTGAGYDA